MDDCLFCTICAKETGTMILFEDDDVVAFRDIAPQAPQHFLVVPKRHITSAAELTEQDGALLGKIFAVITKLCRDNDILDGYRVVTNVGEDGGQSVPHLHFHVLGGRKMSWPPG